MRCEGSGADTCVAVESDSAVSTFKPQLGRWDQTLVQQRSISPREDLKQFSRPPPPFTFHLSEINPPVVSVTEEMDSLQVKLTPPLPKESCMTFEVCYTRCGVDRVSCEI